MSSHASARSEQSKQSPINLASLPRVEALRQARAAGRAILRDSDVVSGVFASLWTDWAIANVLNARSHAGDESGDFINSMMSEFEGGVNEFLESAALDCEPDYAQHFVEAQSRFAWKLYNVIAFMVEAVPDDAAGALPIRCTLVDLRKDLEHLAMNLGDFCGGVSHG